ncbi:MAG TPA: CBS domain-containing protein [Vicinamibacterales bacterium]|nr:CBS domain-containing protein [Vicinamibacterales bacterium]
MIVGDVCRSEVVCATATESVVAAAARMRDRHVGDVVVVDDDRRPIGILTDRDIVVSAVAQTPEQLTGLLVADIMTGEVTTVRRSDPLAAALRHMRLGGIRRVPVVNGDGRLDGIIALDDALTALARELFELMDVVTEQRDREYERRPTARAL